MDIKEKENSVKDLLEEMKLAKVKTAGFTDLYLMGYIEIESHHLEKRDRWGSNGDTLLPAPTIITEEVPVTSLVRFQERLNNVDVYKTSIKDGILNIIYEGKKQLSVSIEHLNRIFVMKAGDTHVY
jgi:hypothetical protein